VEPFGPTLHAWSSSSARGDGRIEGLSCDEVLALADADDDADRNACLLVRATDVEPIAAARSRLREHYPRSPLEMAGSSGGNVDTGEAFDLDAHDPRAVTIEFVRDGTGQDPSDLQLYVLDAALRFADDVDHDAAA
jgi:hypothetical protein